MIDSFKKIGKLMEFQKQKELLLNKSDLSKKGSIDCKIVDLISTLNSQKNYATTSSCSGRTSVFIHSEKLLQTTKKKGCKWIFISHDDTVNHTTVIKALENHSGSAVLKFEPFVLHVWCSSLLTAQNLLAVSVQSGFRNSGLSIGKKGKIIVAVRSTLCLEVPLSHNGKLLVSNEYIEYIVESCNMKMKENWKRIDNFFSGLKKLFLKLENEDLCNSRHRHSAKAELHSKPLEFKS